MLVVSTHPDIGAWYQSQEMEEIFEVIALDQDTDCIDIQYFSGDIEEIDADTWRNIQPLEIAEPEDWSGAYKMSQEDLVNYLDDVIHPERHNSPLTDIEPSSD